MAAVITGAVVLASACAPSTPTETGRSPTGLGGDRDDRHDQHIRHNHYFDHDRHNYRRAS